MTVENAKHIVLVPMIMWDVNYAGHARPMCTLATRLVKLRNVVITMFMSAAFYERVQAEIVKDFDPEEAALLSKITLVPLKQSNSPFDSASYEADFLDTWARFMQGQPLSGYTADRTPRVIDSSEKDSLSGAIIDMFAVHAFKELNGVKDSLHMKVFIFYPAAASALIYWFGEDRIARAEELAARKGVSFHEAAHELWVVSKGALVNSECLPTMYDYEYRPQDIDFPPRFSGDILIYVYHGLREADGMITIDAADYHPSTTAVIRRWFAPKPAYFAGPLVPRSPGVLSLDQAAAEVIKFMDGCLQSHGAKSVILISFGSMFWPADPVKVGVVLDVLMDKGVPFVLSRCSALSVLTDDTAKKLDACATAFVSKWVPQQAALAHPATAWCITHAGHNGVFECIGANVPMILWPIDADQPANAIHLSDNLNVAYELIEVRNGTGLGPIYRTGQHPSGTLEAVAAEIRDVLVRAFGEDGKEKRARLDVLRRTLQAAWAEDGVARREMETFLDTL
ncbi:Glycosyltransferase Family 1 protein [Trametes cinnabarina]|uniref:Glycosyltransferase Family 1 protein n=1 Tax=Pycnoporus cinnabarinus TaxID=5643 RepID=A0A060SM57_PYCCI|nr:Glycosyltransferase Family 1 protein [Trametes cinnabarina]